MNDKEKIKSLGGPAQLAKQLGYKKQGGVQRVHNWMTRGIPPRVKIEFPELFLSAEKPGSDDSLQLVSGMSDECTGNP